MNEKICAGAYGFSGKTYIIVGATSGIGKSVAVQLAANGANVALMARTEARLLEVRNTVAPGNHEVFPLDATNLAMVEHAVGDIKNKYGAVDGMVWCVGTGKTGRLRDLTIEDMRTSFDGSFFAFLEMTKNLVRGKPRAYPLRIVAISSLASSEFQKYLTLYSASKAALEAAIRCLASELGPRNVRINAIRPAFVDTPRLAGLNDVTGNVEETLKNNGYQPLGLIPPDDVAKTVLFMLAETSSFINGVSWDINGGAAC